MNGIQFITNDKGRKLAVQIDRKKHRELWEELSRFRTAGGKFKLGVDLLPRNGILLDDLVHAHPGFEVVEYQ